MDPQIPARRFRYGVRAIRAGRVVLPPVVVAAFDPSSRRFFTRSTASISIEVEEARTFDPASFRYGDPEGDAPAPTRSPARWAWAGAIAGSAATIGFLTYRRSRRLRARRWLAAEVDALARRLDASDSGPEVARQITAGFSHLLSRANARPRGVLTPPEARSAFLSLTGDQQVGDRSARLIGLCDREAYGRGGPGPAELVAEARVILDAIRDTALEGRRRDRGTEGGSRDRFV